MTVDSSSYGLGECLLQDDKPAAFASRSLSKSEKNYGQIEKEMLAIACGCEKFHDYIYGRSDITVETDHKPLEALYKKLIGSAPPRIQRMMLRIQKYSFSVVWRKGKDLIIADTLSRAPQPFTEPNNIEEYEVHSVRNLPISDVRIAEFREETSKDLILQMVQKYVNQGWPDNKNAVPLEGRPFWCVRDELYVSEGLVLRREKLIVPNSLCRSMLSKIHASHLGIEKCTAQAKDLFYWPGMSAQITEMCEQCSTCAEYRTKQQKEPMIVTQVPDYPWQKVASDLFSFDGESYILVGDYFSKFVEYSKLSHDATSASVITFLQEQFARHGIPEQLISDGGPRSMTQKSLALSLPSMGLPILSHPQSFPRVTGLLKVRLKS